MTRIAFISKGHTANLALFNNNTISTFLDVIFPSPEMDLITCLSTVSGVYAKKKRTLLSRSKLGLPETWESFVGKKRTRPKDQKNKDRYQGLGGSYFCIHFMTPVIFTSLGTGRS